jgi:pimeloyl-ACP methyl ester carboxylesterase
LEQGFRSSCGIHAEDAPRRTQDRNMERFVEVPGGRLFVVDEGDGPPVVLLHAGIVDLRSWDGLVSHLVGAGYRAVRYDSRSWGRSTTDDVAYSNRADLVAILDALGIDRAALVGNSRGGQIAIDTALEFPERVVAVVGVGAGLGGFEGHPTPGETALLEEMERLEEAGTDLDAITAVNVQAWVAGPGQSIGRAPAWIADHVRATSELLAASDHVFGRPIVLDPPAATRLHDLRCPVLAVAGALDVSDVAETARHLQDRAPDAHAVILPDVAHMIGMERPAELAGLITGFLDPLTPWS